MFISRQNRRYIPLYNNYAIIQIFLSYYITDVICYFFTYSCARTYIHYAFSKLQFLFIISLFNLSFIHLQCPPYGIHFLIIACDYPINLGSKCIVGYMGNFSAWPIAPCQRTKNYISLQPSRKPNISNIYSESTIHATHKNPNISFPKFSPWLYTADFVNQLRSFIQNDFYSHVSLCKQDEILVLNDALPQLVIKSL